MFERVPDGFDWAAADWACWAMLVVKSPARAEIGMVHTRTTIRILRTIEASLLEHKDYRIVAVIGCREVTADRQDSTGPMSARYT
jgi:hypothetical protein